LLLHLYGVKGERELAASDAICSALQLINFWQDLSKDIPRGRYYLPLNAIAAHQVMPNELLQRQDTANTTNLIAACADFARAAMQKGFDIPAADWRLQRLAPQHGIALRDPRRLAHPRQNRRHGAPHFKPAPQNHRLGWHRHPLASFAACFLKYLLHAS
jgi:hydroxysqualene synthase